MVGRTIGGRLVGLGHEVMLGSRTADNADATAWAAEIGDRATHGAFADAATFGEVLFNCTGGMVSLDALAAAGEDNLAGTSDFNLASCAELTVTRSRAIWLMTAQARMSASR
jgi:hypothetical protein